MSHYFFAAALPIDVKEKMKAELEQLKQIFPFRRWVHHEDLHITLAFLGAAPERELQKSRMLVSEALQGVGPIQLEINGLGTFGRKDQPRVFWAGLDSSRPLHDLRGRVYEACESAGFNLETRPFAPHITLARNWQGHPPYGQETGSPDSLNIGFVLHEVVLYRTHMDRSPKYEPIETYRLQAENHSD